MVRWDASCGQKLEWMVNSEAKSVRLVKRREKEVAVVMRGRLRAGTGRGTLKWWW